MKQNMNSHMLYEEGLKHQSNGTRNDNFKALEAFAQAAKSGHGKAAFLCGVLATEGYYDIGKRGGASYYNRMGDESDALLKKLEKRFYKEALSWFKLAYKLGEPDGLAMLGIYNYYGYGGVKQDYKSSFAQLSQAVSMGSIVALSGLGLCYITGNGCEQDIARGVNLFEIGTKKNNTEAMLQLAECYEKGIGVAKDYQKAFHLIMNAAEQNYPPAIFRVGRYYQYGIGVEEDIKEAISWMEKAQTKYCYYKEMTGDELLDIKDSFRIQCNENFRLGKKYELGDGVQQDDEKAVEHYRIAASYGAYEYRYTLAELLHTTSTSAHNDQEAMIQLFKVLKENNAYYEKAKFLMSRIADTYAPQVEKFSVSSSQLTPEKIISLCRELCQCVSEFMKLDGAPRILSACDNQRANKVYSEARFAEQQGQHFDLALEGYIEAAELGHPDAPFRCWQLSWRIGNVSERNYWEDVLKENPHPRYPHHLPSLLALASKGDPEVLMKLGDFFASGYIQEIPKNEKFSQCFYICAAHIYAFRVKKYSDPEAAYYLQKSLGEYLCPEDRKNWSYVPGYSKYGFVYYDAAVDYDLYEEDSLDYTKKDVELSKKALATGIVKAGEVERIYENNKIARSRQITEERLKRRKALEDYVAALDERERNINLFFEGKYQTEEEAFLLGARDYDLSDWYQQKRNKKIKEFEKSLDL